jgi:hypothetical protein
MPAQNPGRLLTEAVARGMKLIVIDPRRTQTARRAQIHLQPRPGEDAAMTYPVWAAVRDSHVLNDAFAWATDRVALANAGDTRSLEAIWVSGDFLQKLGVSAIAGRTLTDADDRRGGGPDGPVAILSYRAARRLFGDPSSSVGRTVVIERLAFTVVGVMPRDFFGLNVGTDADVVLPLETEPMLNRIPSRQKLWPWLTLLAGCQPAARSRVPPPQCARRSLTFANRRCRISVERRIGGVLSVPGR